MNDDFDWSIATWAGNRLLQHREFLALPFRDKVQILENMAETARWLRGIAQTHSSDRPERNSRPPE